MTSVMPLRTSVCASAPSLCLCAFAFKFDVFVKLIPNLTLKSRGTFQNYSDVLPNFQISRRSKSDHFYGWKTVIFATCSFLGIYKRRPSRHKAAAWLRPCNKGLPAMQRGPRGVATRPPLQLNGVLVATSRGPYGRETVTFPNKIGNQKLRPFAIPEKP